MQDRPARTVMHSRRDGNRECTLTLNKSINNIIVDSSRFREFLTLRKEASFLNIKLCFVCSCLYISDKEKNILFKELFQAVGL